MEDEQIYKSNYITYFEQFINNHISENHLKISSIQKSMGFSKATWYRKLRNPNTLTIDELISLSNILKIDSIKLLKLIKNEIMKNSENAEQEKISLLKTKPSLDMIWQAAESYTNNLKLTGSVYSTTLKINNVDTEVYITLITDTLGVIQIYNDDFNNDSNDNPKFSSKYVGGIDKANNKIILFDEPFYYGELKLAEEKVLSIFK